MELVIFLLVGFALDINNNFLIQFGLSGNVPGADGGVIITFPISYTHSHYCIVGNTTPAYSMLSNLNFFIQNRTPSTCILDWGASDFTLPSFWITVG